MKVLRSLKKPKTVIPLVEFDINDLMLLPSQKWIRKRYPNLKSSIDEVGMIWPIIVTDFKHYWQHEKNWPKDENGQYIPGNLVHTGNKRVIWAKENGYTHIEGYFVKHKLDKDLIISQTFIHKNQYPKSIPQLKEQYK